MKPVPIPPTLVKNPFGTIPRPARLEDTDKLIKVIFNGITLAETQQAKRVLETSHPPVYYIPSGDIKLESVIETPRKTWCEWKGWCQYYDVVVGDKRATYGAWRYFQPTLDFLPIQEYYSFYASLMDACYVNDELVQSQPGDYYGGWITKDIVGRLRVGREQWVGNISEQLSVISELVIGEIFD